MYIIQLYKFYLIKNKYVMYLFIINHNYIHYILLCICTFIVLYNLINYRLIRSCYIMRHVYTYHTSNEHVLVIQNTLFSNESIFRRNTLRRIHLVSSMTML